eukprot:scaffold740_cov405-Prasinococcus_capsulatus_cf.AAC.9
MVGLVERSAPATELHPVPGPSLKEGLLEGYRRFQESEKELKEAQDRPCSLTHPDDTRFAEEQARADIVAAAEAVQRLKQEGNEHFKAEELEEALATWEQGLRRLAVAPLAATVTANRAAGLLRCNKAAALLKLQLFSPALAECNQALRIDPDSVKALFRRAQARRGLKLYSQAVEDLEKALRLEPRNLHLRRELDDVEELLEFEGDGDHKEPDMADPGCVPGEETEEMRTAREQHALDFAHQMMQDVRILPRPPD